MHIDLGGAIVRHEAYPEEGRVRHRPGERAMGSVRAAYQPGLADWLTEHVSSDMGEDAAAGLLEHYCASTGLHAGDNRGRSIREGFSQLVRWIRSRELIADAGIQTGTFPLFTFHVPPGGEGSIAWTSEAQGDGK